MHTKIIAGHELTPGKTIKDHIHVEGTELRVPHVLLCGQHPGATVLISAGIHNAEYVGIQAAIELSNELDVSELHGNVIILPLANRSGFENRTMSMVYEDGKNLNRVFPVTGMAVRQTGWRICFLRFSSGMWMHISICTAVTDTSL